MKGVEVTMNFVDPPTAAKGLNEAEELQQKIQGGKIRL